MLVNVDFTSISNETRPPPLENRELMVVVSELVLGLLRGGKT
jgi:hypothetical protein